MLVVEIFLSIFPILGPLLPYSNPPQDRLYMRTSCLRTWKSYNIPLDLFPFSRPQPLVRVILSDPFMELPKGMFISEVT